MQRCSSTVNVSISADVPQLLKNPKKELLPILRCLPGWSAADPRDVEVSQISGAMTNLIYRCKLVPLKQYVLARIFGSSGALFDREEEQQIFAAVAHAGLGPKLLASFGNGRLEEFLLDQSITAKQMRTGPVAVCIAAAVACFNFTHLSRLPQRGAPHPICWDRLRGWAKSAEELYTPDELEAEGLADIQTEIDRLEAGMTAQWPSWLGFCHNDTQYGNMLLHTASPLTAEQQAEMDDHLHVGTPPLYDSLAEDRNAHGLRIKTSPAQKHHFSVLGGKDTRDPGDEWHYHRPDDLEESQGGSPRKRPLGLTMFDEARLSGTSLDGLDTPEPQLSVRLIDFEYAGMNPVAFDLANHWCEYGADYHTETPHLLDYSNFPDEEQQLLFVRAYLAAVMALKQHEDGTPKRANSLTHSIAAAAASGAASLQEACKSADSLETIVDKLRETALAYVPVSHLGWGIWGLIQARMSDVPTFDFTEYGRQRLREWRKLRPGFLQLKH